MLGELFLELVNREIGAEAGDGLQLVERSARVAESPARHHRNDDARGRRQRSRYQTGFVSHSARGMFVHFDSGNGTQVNGFAGADHAVRGRADLAIRHSRMEDGHEEGGHLIIRNFIPVVAFHKRGNFLWRQFFTISFSVDQIDSSHYEFFSVPSYVFESKGLCDPECGACPA